MALIEKNKDAIIEMYCIKKISLTQIAENIKVKGTVISLADIRTALKNWEVFNPKQLTKKQEDSIEKQKTIREQNNQKNDNVKIIEGAK